MSTEDLPLEQRIEKVLSCGVVTRHSLFQLKYFVVAKEPTHQRRMWRCLEELKVRYDALESLSMQIEDMKDDVSLVEIGMVKFDNSFDIEDAKVITDVDAVELRDRERLIRKRKMERQKKVLEDSLGRLQQSYRDQSQEAEFFLRTFIELEKVEKLKPFDDFESQLEYYSEKYARLLNMKVLLQLPLDTELIQSALALPDASPVKKQVMSLLDNQHRQLAALKNQSLPAGQ